MKTIKVFIASSEELHLERLEFTDMIMQLNKALKPRGIEIEPVKWEYLDASMNAERKQTEYNIALKECELCLVMYWTKFGEYTEEELTTAWEGLKAGENPRKLYVYFKEPGDASQELKDFKESFVTRYGHFYCKFENVDTLRLNFLLQFEQYQSANFESSQIVKVQDSKVEVNGQPIVNLCNVPFAGNNISFNNYRKDIEELDKQIDAYKMTLLAVPGNETIENLLHDARIRKDEKKKELEKLENNLLNTAKQIVSLSYTESNNRLRKAIELFESGNNDGANAVLDFNLISSDLDYNSRQIDVAEQLKNNALKALLSNIEECKLKIKTIQNQKLNGWFAECKSIISKAIESAHNRVDEIVYVELLHEKYLLLIKNNDYSEIEEISTEISEIYIKLHTTTNLYLSEVIRSYNELGDYYLRQFKHDEAIKFVNKSLALEAQYVLNKPNIVNEITNSHQILGTIYHDHREHEKAKSEYQHAIESYSKIYSPQIKDEVNHYAHLVLSYLYLELDLHHYDECLRLATATVKKIEPYFNNSEETKKITIGYYTLLGNCYQEKKDSHTSISYYEKAVNLLESLSEQSPEEYEPKLSYALGSLSFIYYEINDFKAAETTAQKAVSISRLLYASNSDAYALDYISSLGVLSQIYTGMKKYSKAEEENLRILSLSKELYENNAKLFKQNYAYAVVGSAILHNEMFDYDKAEEEFTLAIKLFRELSLESPEAFKPFLARHLGNRATLYIDLHKNALAKQDILEAIEIFEDLKDQDDDAYTNEYAQNLCHMSSLLCNSYDYINAETYCQKAVDIYRELNKKDSMLFLDSLALNLGNLAIIHGRLNKNDLSITEFLESIELFEICQKERTYDFKQEISRTHGNLANRYLAINQYSSAKEEYRKAIEGFEDLNNTENNAFVSEVALWSGNYANLLHETNQKDEAAKVFEKVLDLYSALLKDNYDAYIIPYLRNLGNYASLKNDIEPNSCNDIYMEFFKCYNQIQNVEIIKDFDRDLAEFAKKYASYLYSNRDYELANQYIDKSIEILSHNAYNKSSINNLINAYSLKGDIGKSLKEYDLSIQAYDSAINCCNSDKIDKHIVSCAKNHGKKALLLYDIKRFNEAENEYNQSITLYKKANLENKGKYNYGLATQYGNLGVLYYFTEEYDKAEFYYLEAISLFEKCNIEKTCVLENIALYSVNFAVLKKNTNNYVEAKKYYLSAIDIYEKLSSNNNLEFLKLYVKNLESLTFVHVKQNSLDEAIIATKKIIVAYRRMNQIEHNKYNESIARSLYNMGYFYSSIDLKEAEKFYLESIESYKVINKPDNLISGVLNGLSYVYFKQGNTISALNSIDKAILLSNNNPHYIDSKGEFLFKMGRKDEARKLWEKVIDIDPDFIKHSDSTLYKLLNEEFI